MYDDQEMSLRIAGIGVELTDSRAWKMPFLSVSKWPFFLNEVTSPSIDDRFVEDKGRSLTFGGFSTSLLDG